MKYSVIIFLILLSSLNALGQQTIRGKLTKDADATIYLTGFRGLTSYNMDSTVVSANGEFSLQYPDDYNGMGILSVGPQQSHVVVLESGGMHFTGTNLIAKDSMQIVRGEENKRFVRYAAEHQRRDRVLSGWLQMNNIYTHDTLFSKDKEFISQIEKEVNRIKSEDSLYIAHLPDDSYCKWYLPYRSLVGSVQTVAMHRTDEIPKVLEKFREINYADPRWQTSGMMKDALEAHVWLIENSAGPLDSVYDVLNISTDILIEKLKDNPEVLNTVIEHLFKFLEQRSLFTSSEYLALKMLNDESCILETDLSKMMESYRAMKTGNTAAEIIFTGDLLSPGYINEDKLRELSELSSKYKVVIFGASWCPHCSSELQEITKHYTNWTQHGVEVVFISLDEDKQAFAEFTKSFPFISFCDYQKWNSKPAQDYHVFATPTIYLLNDKNEILLKPRFVAQLNAWVDWYLVKGNK